MPATENRSRAGWAAVASAHELRRRRAAGGGVRGRREGRWIDDEPRDGRSRRESRPCVRFETLHALSRDDREVIKSQHPSPVELTDKRIRQVLVEIVNGNGHYEPGRNTLPPAPRVGGGMNPDREGLRRARLVYHGWSGVDGDLGCGWDDGRTVPVPVPPLIGPSNIRHVVKFEIHPDAPHGARRLGLGLQFVICVGLVDGIFAVLADDLDLLWVHAVLYAAPKGRGQNDHHASHLNLRRMPRVTPSNADLTENEHSVNQ